MIIFNYANGLWAFLGLLMVPGGYLFYKYMGRCALFVKQQNGETAVIDTSSEDVLTKMDVAIQQQLARLKAQRDDGA